MKKLSSLLLFTILSVASMAQSMHIVSQPLRKKIIANNTRALGDTLLHIPLVDIRINAADSAAFTIITEDMDGLFPFNPGYTYDFSAYYSVNDTTTAGDPIATNYYHPWETPAALGGNDTAYFWSATSYFTPPGIADNWLEFGPITIPATGGKVYWYDRTYNRRDGYELLVSTSGMSNYSDFSNPPIFSEADGPAPSPTYATDTAWELKSATIPSWYNGQPLYFAFHHTANHCNFLFFDEIAVVEDTVITPGACSAAFSIVQDTANLYNYTIYSSASIGAGITYLWDFGDTTYDYTAYPTHLYTGSGPYQICLFVQDTLTGCTASHCDSITPGMWMSATTTITVVPSSTDVEEVLTDNTFDVFPNPVSNDATIRFELMKDQAVSIIVTDLLGKVVSGIDERNFINGKSEIHWDSEGLSNGMYLMRMHVGQSIFTKKLVVNRK